MGEPHVMPAMREWWEAHKPRPPERKPPVPRKERVYYPITDDERRAAAALTRVRFGSFSSTGMYVASLAKANKISEGGRHLLWRWVWRYRRQIADKRLVEMARRIEAAASASAPLAGREGEKADP